MELLLSRRLGGMPVGEFTRRARDVVLACRAEHEDLTKIQQVEDISDRQLLSLCRYTDGLPLKSYENALSLVPKLVNLVSLAEAVPIDGSSLPFDLKAIAVKCRDAVYFAPKRFTAIQLAYDSPRSRILLFRTYLHPPLCFPSAVYRVDCDACACERVSVCAHRHRTGGGHGCASASRRRA
jgi:hypothetical protein